MKNFLEKFNQKLFDDLGYTVENINQVKSNNEMLLLLRTLRESTNNEGSNDPEIISAYFKTAILTVINIKKPYWKETSDNFAHDPYLAQRLPGTLKDGPQKTVSSLISDWNSMQYKIKNGSAHEITHSFSIEYRLRALETIFNKARFNFDSHIIAEIVICLVPIIEYTDSLITLNSLIN